MEEDRPSSKGKAGTSKVAEEKDNTNEDKDAEGKGPSITNQQTNGKPQRPEDGSEMLSRNCKVTRWGAAQEIVLYSLNRIERTEKWLFP